MLNLESHIHTNKGKSPIKVILGLAFVAFLIFVLSTLVWTKYYGFTQRDTPNLTRTAEKPSLQFPAPMQVKSESLQLRRNLVIPFHVSGQEGLAIYQNLSDLKASLGLYLRLPSKILWIQDLSELKGYVQIKSNSEALAFCRLRTSPITYLCWSRAGYKVELEVTSKDQVNKEFCFGYQPMADIFQRRISYKGFIVWGVVGSREKMAQYGIEPATVRQTPRGYEVRRTLLVADYDAGGKQLCTVSEFVERDGGYNRKVVAIRQLADPSRWLMRLTF